jgi:glucan-binding YG repeat protein
MTKVSRITSIIISILLFTTIIYNPLLLNAAKAIENGKWVFDSGGWKYQRAEGEYSSNQWEKVNGKWYFFDEHGYMVTGWKSIAGKWYFFNSSGAMQKGWQKVNSNWYYLNSSGAMETGWIKLSNNWYYLKPNGVMAHDDWISGRYYVGTNGVMYVNRWTPDGYFVGQNGAWISSIRRQVTINGQWKHDRNGSRFICTDGNYIKSDWAFISGNWYYFNSLGYMHTGWLTQGEKTYYFNESGVMQTGWLKYKASYEDDTWVNWYYFDYSGVMQTGWEKINGKWYYFREWGAMETGRLYINDKEYFLDYDTGAMHIGWKNDYGEWYYYDNSGVMQTGWQRIGSNWYYFNEWGTMATGWLDINGELYYLDNESGAMKTGWMKDSKSGEWHYFDKSGRQVFNKWVGDYYLLANGCMAKNKWIGEYYVDQSGKKDSSVSRILAENLNIEGLSIGSYDYYYSVKGNFSSPDKLHYYLDSTGNLNVVAYDHKVDFDGYEGNKKLVINKYDTNLKFLSQNIVNLPYDLWGGFYQAKDGHFYVVCGQKNEECSEDKSVIKVLKYSSSWKLVGETDIYGSASNIFIGIQEPFHAGNCRMDMYENFLFIHMGRLMFPASDGVSHQGNISFKIDVNTMKEVKNVTIPYVSHSFNQFVRYDNGNILYIDHGDAYPRSIRATLVKDDHSTRRLDLFEFQSGVGHYNFTGATLSGLGIGVSNNVIVGMAQPHDHAINGVTGYNNYMAYNVYQIIFDKELNQSTFKWITQYNPLETSKSVNEPRLIRVSNNKFAIIFSNKENGVDMLQYRLIDDEGNILASHSYKGIYFPASSDPVILNENIVWVAPDKEEYDSMSNYFYKIPVLHK